MGENYLASGAEYLLKEARANYQTNFRDFVRYASALVVLPICGIGVLIKRGLISRDNRFRRTSELERD